MANDSFDFDDLFNTEAGMTVQESDADRTLIRLTEYLLDEVADMFDLIQKVFNEVHSVQENVVSETMAKRELYAVVESTAEATNDILENTEALEKMLKMLPQELQKDAIVHITKMYEACTFQDLTGQRIKKVVKTILDLESKLSQIMETIKKSSNLKHIAHADESTITKPKISPDIAKNESEDEKLMQGPALPENATSQFDIDRILKGTWAFVFENVNKVLIFSPKNVKKAVGKIVNKIYSMEFICRA